jgi:hypothetical protein
MGVLSNALPGVRDIRAPLTAGYLWLLFAWVVGTPDLDNRPGDEPMASLWDLADDVGRVGLALAVSVAAYLIGAISQEASDWSRRRLIRSLRRLGGSLRGVADRIDPDEVPVDEGSGVPIEFVGAPAERDWARIRLVEEYFRGAVASGREEAVLPTTESADFRAQLARATTSSAAAIDAELNLPATLLIGEHEQLFAEVDRLRSEADFRLTLAVPLLALIVVMAAQVSPWWLVAAPGLGVLVRQGLRRESEARKIMGDALGRGVIESSALASFSEQLTKLEERVRSRAAAQSSQKG